MSVGIDHDTARFAVKSIHRWWRRMGGTIDIISFGPRIEGAHSPDERVYSESVQKSWTYLRAELAKG